MARLNIPIILGASRPKRESEKVARVVLQVSKEFPEVESMLIDVRDFKIDYDEDTSVPEFHEIVRKADAFFLVFPEYNHSFPGKLKTLLDTEFDEYKYKPVALASVSSGDFGGVRAVEAITPFLICVGLIVSGINLHFPRVEEIFEENGELKDKKRIEKVKLTWKKLIHLTEVIKKGKELVGD